MRRALLSVALAYTIGVHSQGTDTLKGPSHYEHFEQKATCNALNRHGGEGVPDPVTIDIGEFSLASTRILGLSE